jgi:hypothetical protein
VGNVNLPPDWPASVAPPGSEDWEASAVTWLFEWVPGYRLSGVLRRHPVMLAFIARHTLDGAVNGMREGYRTARTGLEEVAPPHAVDGALVGFRDEGRRLAAAARGAHLIEQALRGASL